MNILFALALLACDGGKEDLDTGGIDTAIITPGDDDGGTDDTGEVTPGDDGGADEGGDDTGPETGIITPGDDTEVETGIITPGDDTGDSGPTIDTEPPDTGGGVDTEEEKEDAPQVAWLDPLGGEYLYGAIPLEVSAEDDVVVVGIDFQIDGASIGYDLDGEPWTIDWDSDAFSEGAHSLKAIGYDDVGETGEAEIEVTIDRTPPDVTITNPADGDQVSGTVTVEASVVEVNLDAVAFYIDGALVDTFGPGDTLVYDWDTSSWPTGSYPIQVVATDLAGHTGSDEITVDVVSAPAVIILEPADGEAISGAVDVTVEATDDGTIDHLDINLDGALFATLTGASPYGVTWDTCGVTPGDVEIEATAQDDEGLVGADAVTVTVDQPFSIDLLGPSGTVDPTETLEATLYDDRAIVDVTWDLDGTPIASTAAAGTLPAGESCDYGCGCDYYTETADLTGFAAGTYTLTVTATNDDGETATDSTTVIIDSDEDGDGYVTPEWGGDDCDDTDADINPGADEICDEVDDDCDDVVDEDALDGYTWCADDDLDGFGTPDTTYTSCDQPEGFVADCTDCDDSDGGVNPAEDEVCDGIDNDCDGDVDEDDAIDAGDWYADDDSDGFGDPGDSTAACEEPAGYTGNDDDCDDTDGSVNPDADEICGDGIDNDCDGEVDEADAVGGGTWYADDDGDGYGDTGDSVTACEEPDGYTDNDDDCDDTDAAVNPDAAEVCDEIDNNCDGDVDEGVTDTYYADGDGDGYGDADSGTAEACEEPDGYSGSDDDCDDTDAAVNPGATEVCNDIDDDCDGLVDDDDDSLDDSTATTWYEDTDGDGYGDPGSAAVVSCDDPGDDYTDDDGDCDDDNADVNPGAVEICDGIDNDCDGSTSEDGVVTLDGEGAFDTIQAALNLASDGSVVTICDGTYGENLTVYDDVTLQSLNGASAVTVNAGGAGSVINIQSGNDVRVERLTLTGGIGWYDSSLGARLGGGINAYYADSLEVYGCIIESNQAYFGGGIIGSGYTGDLIEETIIRYNSADYGGGVAMFGGELVAVELDANDAGTGGGAWIYGDQVSMDSDTVVIDNVALVGGGVYASTADLYLDEATTVSFNEAYVSGAGTGGGGGIYLTDGSLSGGLVTDNYAGDYGGGLFVAGAYGLDDVVVESNAAAYGGGGAVLYDTNITVTNLTISANDAYLGGGIWAEDLNATLRDSEVTDNTADYGGAVLAYITSGFNLRSSVIQDNTASGTGGGVYVVGRYNSAGTTLLQDSTVSSTTSDWGSGSTDNTPYDAVVDYYLTSYSYGTSASFTCSVGAGGCY